MPFIKYTFQAFLLKLRVCADESKISYVCMLTLRSAFYFATEESQAKAAKLLKSVCLKFVVTTLHIWLGFFY